MLLVSVTEKGSLRLCISCSDARGLTEAIDGTGKFYEEIGNLHGEQVK